MMLHRHFEAEQNKNVTKFEDVTPHFVSDVFPPDEADEVVEAPKKRGRPKKTEE